MRTRDRVQRMLAPKLRGAIALDAATADQEFDAFVLFASTSGFSGIPGQCDYAAANSALDAFATWRSGARRGRTLAVDWERLAGRRHARRRRGDEARAVPAWFGERRERAGDVEFAGPGRRRRTGSSPNTGSTATS
ncbi:MAG: ketoreductase domain-containing protein [Planctomycetota bacterium]